MGLRPGWASSAHTALCQSLWELPGTSLEWQLTLSLWGGDIPTWHPGGQAASALRGSLTSFGSTYFRGACCPPRGPLCLTSFPRPHTKAHRSLAHSRSFVSGYC